MPNTGSKIREKPLFEVFLGQVDRINESKIEQFFESFVSQSTPSESSTFLTILMRTQGKRLNAFYDSLMSLYSQTCQDYEIILLEHNTKPTVQSKISSVIEDFPDRFVQKIRRIQVHGGGRARPLNVGLELIESPYFAALDDDDIVFANWVEVFKEGATRAPGRMIRSITSVQQVELEKWSDGSSGFRATSWPEVPYNIEYSQVDHLLVNHSPFMSIAFPTAIYSNFGLRFDEELSVCEDWDMILRAGSLCGVHQNNEMTAIYRNWQGVETSYTEHSSEEWRISEKKVIDKLSASPFLMEAGSVEEIRNLAQYKSSQEIYSFMFKDGFLRLPFRLFFRVISPLLRLFVRIRNKLRTMLRRNRNNDTQ